MNTANPVNWSSRLAFLMAAVGSAVGLANIWRFPFTAGVSGGGAFVIIYLFAVLLLALPLVIAELAIGRRGAAPPPRAIATVAVGYADGYLRALSNRGSGYIGETRVPLVGRVSMDLITFDVSAVPESQARPGAMIDVIGPHNPIDLIAAEAGTIGYEIRTGLGTRYPRVYRGGGC